MRNIKFRAWNKEKNIMCYENEDNSAGYLDCWVASDIQVINQTLNSDYIKKTYDFMEFTELKDKNGKEIYEGDIIKCYNNKYEVFFKEERGGFSPFANDGGCGCCCDIDTCGNDDCEVIGNIYDNPELLED